VLEIQEVYLKTIKQYEESPDGSKNMTSRKVYMSRPCLLNKKYIVAIYPHEFSSSGDMQKLNGNFPKETRYSRVILDGNSFRSSEIIVVSSFEKLVNSLK